MYSAAILQKELKKAGVKSKSEKGLDNLTAQIQNVISCIRAAGSPLGMLHNLKMQ